MSTIITDELDTLKVSHYTECDNSSSKEVKEMRGIITENNTTLCKSFPFTPEVTTENLEEFTTLIGDELERAKWYESHEGTILRLWEHNGKWHLSTHRKIDSFLSKWGGKSSYGELFTSALVSTKGVWNKTSWADEDSDEEKELNSPTLFDIFCKLCDKDHVYVFLLRNTNDNRIVVKGYTTPHLFLLGTFHRPTHFTYHPPKENFPIKSPQEYKPNKGKVLSDCAEYVNGLDPFKVQGLIAITPSGKMFKLVHPMYYRYEACRANVPNLDFRYLELINQSEQKELFLELYSEQAEELKECETILSDISTNIFKKYLQRFIHKHVVVLPPTQFKIMKAIHGRFLNKEISKVTPQVVNDTIFSLSGKELYACVKQYKKNKRDNGNGHFVSQENKNKILTIGVGSA
jgi:hypothetical protein